jgi:hypothetical protein
VPPLAAAADLEETMSTLVMYDDTNAALIPATASIIGYYVDGLYANGAAIAKRFPRAELVGIAVRAADDADALDVENGDAVTSDVYGWLNRQIARKVYRPPVYISVSRVDLLMETMNANRFPRGAYRLWSAHYGAGQHICGPDSCKLTKTECDWTQWTDTYNGVSLDASLLSDTPFGPPPAPAPKVVSDAQMQAALSGIAGSLGVLVAGLSERKI